MTRSRAPRLLFFSAATLLLAVGLWTIASNRLFLAQMTLVGGGVDNWVSIPYNNSYTDAATVFGEIAGCQAVCRWDAQSQAETCYPGTNFALVPGEALKIQVLNPTTWTVTGSHDPTLVIHLYGGGGDNWISLPFHPQAANAADLYAETGASSVTRYNATLQQFESYSGGRGSVNFSLVPGEAVNIVRASPLDWAPGHK